MLQIVNCDLNYIRLCLIQISTEMDFTTEPRPRLRITSWDLDQMVRKCRTWWHQTETIIQNITAWWQPRRMTSRSSMTSQLPPCCLPTMTPSTVLCCRVSMPYSSSWAWGPERRPVDRNWCAWCMPVRPNMHPTATSFRHNWVGECHDDSILQVQSKIIIHMSQFLWSRRDISFGEFPFWPVSRDSATQLISSYKMIHILCQMPVKYLMRKYY